MDLNLFFRVVRRFRFIVVVGAIVAGLLALLSFTRITSSGLTYRQPTQYGSTQELLVTATVPLKLQTAIPSPPDPSRLALTYSTLATSNAVSGLMRQNSNSPGKLVSTVELNPDGTASQIVDLEGVSTSPAGAEATARLGTHALSEYVRGYNARAYPNVAITLQPLGGPGAAKVVRSASVTRPIFVFLAVMTAVFGLIFVLENLRPAVRVQSTDRDGEMRQMTARRAGDQSR